MKINAASKTSAQPVASTQWEVNVVKHPFSYLPIWVDEFRVTIKARIPLGALVRLNPRLLQ